MSLTKKILKERILEKTTSLLPEHVWIVSILWTCVSILGLLPSPYPLSILGWAYLFSLVFSTTKEAFRCFIVTLNLRWVKRIYKTGGLEPSPPPTRVCLKNCLVWSSPGNCLLTLSSPAPKIVSNPTIGTACCFTFDVHARAMLSSLM